MKGLENDPSQIGVKDFVLLNGEPLVFATQNKVHVYGLRYRRIDKSWDLECNFNLLRFTSFIDTLRTMIFGATNFFLPSQLMGRRWT